MRLKHQGCDQCGGRFGLVTHRWWGNKFCKRACKAAYIRNVGFARYRSLVRHSALLRSFMEALLGPPGNVQLALLIEGRKPTPRKNQIER